jgi:hypothetical protein
LSAIRLLAALLALGAAQAAAQAPLKLPRTQGEIRALMRETNDPICLRCGVVASTNTLAGAASSGPQPGDSSLPLPGSSGLDPGVGTVPFGSDRAKADRDRMRQAPPQRYEVVVRYDDGTLGRLELAQDPRLKRGDRVKVEDGRIERYP